MDYLSSLVAYIYHYVLIPCMYACSLNELNLLLYLSVMSLYLYTMLVLGTCIVRHVCKITYAPYGIKYTLYSSQLRHTYRSLTTTRKYMHGVGGLTIKIAMS